MRLGAATALFLSVGSLTACGGGEEPAAPAERPNLIVVMTDDQTLESFGPEAMPYAWELFHDERSVVFERAVASPPLCCPARAGFITGQYPHNHGVLGNEPGYADLRDQRNVLPAWLDHAGYQTAFVGKYLNGYEQARGERPAPGWASWHGVQGYPAYSSYVMNDDGELTRYGSGPDDYSTAQFTDRAVREIRGGRSPDPLFMWLAYNAPHLAASRTAPCDGYLPEPPSREAYEKFADAPLPRDPSFNEADRSDKPRAVAARSPLSDRAIAEVTLRWRCNLATLRALDEGIERLVEALDDAGELENTLLVFISDNGYFFGSHGIDDDKRLPYRQSADVPLAIRVGASVGPAPPDEIGEMVSNVDLAPTLLDYANAKPCLGAEGCRAVDGRSLRALLEGDADDWPRDRAVLLELDEDYAYEALRTRRYLYSILRRDRAGELPSPAIELYDLARDPYELDNLWQTDQPHARPVAARLDRRLHRLAACRGSEEARFPSGGAPGDCE